MPVSHIGLAVSHLPTSSSFFLSALQPLGYRYIGQQGNQVGFGIHEADFFICQETTGVKQAAAHIAFSAPSRIVVRHFYTAALTAGARPHGPPACRNEENGYFNAAVLDLDGNSIEVVYREDKDHPGSVAGTEPSRVLNWRESVADSLTETESIERRTSASSIASTAKKALTTVTAVAPTALKDLSTPKDSTPPPPPAERPTLVQRSFSVDSGASKTLIGTLLGAAAGAAVAYAMVRGEQDGARAEADAYQASLSSSERKRSLGNESPRRNFSVTESIYISPAHRHERTVVRAIEAPPPAQGLVHPTYEAIAPPSERLPESEFKTYMYVPPTRSAFRELPSASGPSIVKPAKTAPTLISSFVPSETAKTLPLLLAAPDDDAGSTTSHRSRRSRKGESKAPSHAPSRARSASPPSRARSEHHSKAPSEHHSKAPSEHRSKAPSEHQLKAISEHHSKAPSEHHSTARSEHRSKAPSEHHSKAPSKHTSHSSSPESAPTHALTAAALESLATKPPSAAPSKAPSKSPSTHHRYIEVEVITEGHQDAAWNAHRKALDIGELDVDIDDATVVPSDSISQVGSSPSTRRRRRKSPSERSHHSHRSDGGRSHHSSRSKRTHSSKHATAETVHEHEAEHGRDHDGKSHHSSSGRSHRSRRDSHQDAGGSARSSHSHNSPHSRVSKLKTRDGEEVLVVRRKEDGASRVLSETGSTSTVKPLKRGSVVTLPSSDKEKERKGRSVATFAG